MCFHGSGFKAIATQHWTSSPFDLVCGLCFLVVICLGFQGFVVVVLLLFVCFLLHTWRLFLFFTFDFLQLTAQNSTGEQFLGDKGK